MSIHSVLNGLQRRRTLRRSNSGHTGRLLLFETFEDRCLLSLTTIASYSAGTQPDTVLTADFNNDGRLDLMVANPSTSSVSVLLGNEGGTFQPAASYAAGTNPESIAVGDFDGDGKLDLAAANRGTYGVSVAIGNGDGSFRAPSNIDVDSGVESLAVGDFNKDGKLDVIVTSNYFYPENGDWYPYSGNANVLLGNGDGSFAAPRNVWWFYTRRVGSVVVGDVNGDGNLDFVTSYPDYGEIQVALGDGQGNFPQRSWASVDGLSKVTGDINGDGTDDLVTASGDDVQVLLGPLDPQNWGGWIGRSPQHYAANNPSWVTLGDFDHDGELDIAAANPGNNEVSILRGRGDGTFDMAEDFSVGSAASTSDFNGDGKVNSADYVLWRKNGGTQSEYNAWRANFGQSATPITDPHPVSVVAGDFNRDGWLDVATANINSSSVSVLLNDQSWTVLPPAISVSDAAVIEGATGTANALFTLSLSKAAAVDVTIHYSTSDNTATAGSDYVPASGDVTIPAGQTSATFAVAVLGDRFAEPDETFALNLSAPTNATIGDGQGFCNIIDDEPRISINDVTKSEGNGTKTTFFVFTVTLSAAYDQPVTMSYQTVDGTATASENDYIAQAGTLTFNPGETTKTITIEVKGDNKREEDEWFSIILLDNSSNSLVTKFSGIGTILNDDH
jgi:hypothetical protein